jgi:hypothetical protein
MDGSVCNYSIMYSATEYGVVRLFRIGGETYAPGSDRDFLEAMKRFVELTKRLDSDREFRAEVSYNYLEDAVFSRKYYKTFTRLVRAIERRLNREGDKIIPRLFDFSISVYEQ